MATTLRVLNLDCLWTPFPVFLPPSILSLYILVLCRFWEPNPIFLSILLMVWRCLIETSVFVSVRISGNAIGDDGVSGLSTAFCQSNSIESLSLSRLLSFLSPFFSSLPTLRHFFLCTLCSSSLSYTLSVLCVPFFFQKKFLVCSFSSVSKNLGNGIGVSGARDLGLAISRSSSLQYLDLTGIFSIFFSSRELFWFLKSFLSYVFFQSTHVLKSYHPFRGFRFFLFFVLIGSTIYFRNMLAIFCFLYLRRQFDSGRRIGIYRSSLCFVFLSTVSGAEWYGFGNLKWKIEEKFIFICCHFLEFIEMLFFFFGWDWKVTIARHVSVDLEKKISLLSNVLLLGNRIGPSGVKYFAEFLSFSHFCPLRYLGLSRLFSIFFTLHGVFLLSSSIFSSSDYVRTIVFVRLRSNFS